MSVEEPKFIKLPKPEEENKKEEELESPAKKIIIDDEERTDCKVCDDSGQCPACARGQALIKKMREDNASKGTKKGKFYAKKNWKF